MKLIRKVVLCVLLIPIGLLFLSFFLPSTYRVERTTSIRAEAGAIYPYLSSPKQWRAWSAWSEETDPSLTLTYPGPAEGVGAILQWDGKKLGAGTMTIASADPQTGVHYDLSVEDGRFQSKGAVLLTASQEGTKVTWTDEGELGWNPVGRFFGLMADGMIGRDFEKGLSKLKVLVESQ